MPLPPPANLSEWEREDYRLWLGSEGWYGLEKVKEYKALLAAHRANAPVVPGRKSADEEREITRLQASDDIGLDIAYYSALQCFALWSPSLVEWIDTQAPQGVRNLILLGAARLYENMRRHFVDTKKKPIRVPPSGGGRVPGVKPLKAGRDPGVLARLAGLARLPLQFFEEERRQVLKLPAGAVPEFERGLEEVRRALEAPLGFFSEERAQVEALKR